MTQKNTTAALPVYIAERSIEDLAAGYGSGSIAVYAHGFWSDVITIRFERKINWSKRVAHLGLNEQPEIFEWHFSVSHSSGARDTDQVADDLEAEQNFGMAVLAAVQYARTLRSQAAEFEKAYRGHEARREAKEAEEKAKAVAAKQARAAADTVLGKDGAANLISAVKAATNRRVSNMLYVYDLGDEKPVAICARAGKDGVVRFSSAGAVLSTDKLLTMLSISSSRSHALAI